MIGFADATEFKDRWMQPFLVILPLAFAHLAFKNEHPLPFAVHGQPVQ